APASSFTGILATNSGNPIMNLFQRNQNWFQIRQQSHSWRIPDAGDSDARNSRCAIPPMGPRFVFNRASHRPVQMFRNRLQSIPFLTNTGYLATGAIKQLRARPLVASFAVALFIGIAVGRRLRR
ncbi:MAG TPA: hypothetical protein VFN13_06240, partial [Rudaea sp.]|nr:hypothetical protein [Rudaea sp.]